MTQPLDLNELAEQSLTLWNKGSRPLKMVILAALTKLAEEKRTTAERCAERLNKENEELTADLTRHKAALKAATDALEKCSADIRLWSDVLAAEWRNFDGQLYQAMHQSDFALQQIKELNP